MEQSGYVTRPDYRVDVLARRNRVTVSSGGEVLADSRRALLVDEQDHGLVFYFPPDDVRLERFVADGRTTRCPFKGTATYRRLDAEDREVLISADNVFIALAHLADNSARHGARHLEIAARGEGAMLRLSLRDDGEGVSAKNRARIFDSFFTTRRESGGTGMGLAIVKSLLEAQGGAIVLGEAETGACFELALPIQAGV